MLVFVQTLHLTQYVIYFVFFHGINVLKNTRLRKHDQFARAVLCQSWGGQIDDRHGEDQQKAIIFLRPLPIVDPREGRIDYWHREDQQKAIAEVIAYCWSWGINNWPGVVQHKVIAYLRQLPTVDTGGGTNQWLTWGGFT